MPLQILTPRREFLRRMSWAGALCTTPGLFAEQLTLTPRQTEGPFYPDRLPLDTDNDLVVVVRWIDNGPALDAFLGKVLAAVKS